MLIDFETLRTDGVAWSNSNAGEAAVDPTGFLAVVGNGNSDPTVANKATITETSGLALVFSFVGLQPGRWWVVAKDAQGQEIETSEIVYFGYAI